MVLTGDPSTPSARCAWGLVSEVVPPADLRGPGAGARRRRSRAARRSPPQTGKANLRAAYAMALEAAIGYERDLQTICFATEDAAEGRAAFKERRPGVFRGA